MGLPNLIYLFLLAFFIFSPFQGYAQDSQLLTEERIKEFIHKSSDITNGMQKDMSKEEIAAFLNTHLHENARFKSNMKYVIPGYPSKENKMTVNKEEFIENVQSGAQTLEDYSHEISVKTINISSDKRKATVLTSGKEAGTMVINTDGKEQKVPVIGQSSCNQIIMLSDANVIQMFNANCSTEIQFQDF